MSASDAWFWSDLLPRWTTLSKLAKSPIVRASLLTPVLGALIILNAEAIKWVWLSADALAFNEAQVRGWTVRYLQWLYLSMILWAAGAALFHIGRPDVISRYPSLEAWLSRSRPKEAPYLEEARFERLARIALKGSQSFFSPMGPRTLKRHEAIFEICKNFAMNRDVSGVIGIKEKIGSDDHKSIITMYLDKDPALEQLWSQVRPNVEGFDYDYQVIQFEVFDQSRIIIRIFISAMFLLGSICLAIPSFNTSIRVLNVIFTGWLS